MTVPANGTWLSTTEFAIDITFISICSILICLRLWARTIQTGGLTRRSLTWSDLFVIIGFIFTFGNTACSIATVIAGGNGKHVEDVTPQEQANGQKAMFTAAFCWLGATCTLKISILILYLEIFSASSRAAKIAIWIIIGLVSSFFLGFLLTIFLQCFPFSMNWEKHEEGHCVNLAAESKGGAFINVVFDIMITMLPIPLIAQLQMPLRKKAFLILLFGLGMGADGVNVARAALAMNPSGPDYTWTSAKTNILAAMELWLGVIVACVPTLKPAFSKMHVGLTVLSSRDRSYKHSSKGSPSWRSDPESGRLGESSRNQTPDSISNNKMDPWERQYQHLSDSEDDVVLSTLYKSGITETRARGDVAVSPSPSRREAVSREGIRIQKDMEVYQTSHGSSTPPSPIRTPLADGYSMI